MKTLAITSRRRQTGRRLRVCALENFAYVENTVEANIKTLARLQAEARRRGRAKTTAWLGERLEFWGQFLPPSAVAEVIADALN